MGRVLNSAHATSDSIVSTHHWVESNSAQMSLTSDILTDKVGGPFLDSVFGVQSLSSCLLAVCNSNSQSFALSVVLGNAVLGTNKFPNTHLMTHPESFLFIFYWWAFFYFAGTSASRLRFILRWGITWVDQVTGLLTSLRLLSIS